MSMRWHARQAVTHLLTDITVVRGNIHTGGLGETIGEYEVACKAGCYSITHRHHCCQRQHTYRRSG